MSAIDVAQVRSQTRGCYRVTHFNNAGSSLMPIPVADSMAGYLKEEEFFGGYETAARRDADLEEFYSAAARMLNCGTDEVAFIENATRAWDMVFYSFDFAPGDRILTSVSEYASNMISYLQRAKQTGAKVEIVPDDNHGQIDVAALDRMIDGDVKLISISHIPTGGGLVNPAAEVGKIAKKHGVPYLLDACQSAGQMPLDVKELGCDMLSGTGRKYLRGPRGTGFLYVSKEWIQKLEPVMLDLHSAKQTGVFEYEMRDDARRFENWECNFAGKVGLAHAINYALDLGLNAIQSRVFSLGDHLRRELLAIPGITVTDEGAEKCGIVTFMHGDHSADKIARAAEAASINVSTSSPAGMFASYEKRGLELVVRSSVHYFNTEEEIAKFTGLIKQL